MDTINKVGQAFVEYLANEHIKLEQNEDGRLESLNSEDNITDKLREHFENDVKFLVKSDNRSFGDIDVKIDNIIYPINVKMVDEARTFAYNGGSVKVFNYVLFGKPNTNWMNLVNNINTIFPKTIFADYYYLIFYKRSNKRPQFISLTEIHETSIVANPSNPIQIKRNLVATNRTDIEKVEFVRNLAIEVLQKRAKPYLNLEMKWRKRNKWREGIE